ncbi:MAG: hypothetical protein LWX01_09255 [Deltaproteobacteria bacterium]|nr:hypothetical protein [Deltaproteobacteria bacterium]
MVSDYLKRARMAGLSWPLPEDLSDTAIEHKLFPPPTPRNSSRFYPDFQEVHKELQTRKGVTLYLFISFKIPGSQYPFHRKIFSDRQAAEIERSASINA